MSADATMREIKAVDSGSLAFVFLTFFLLQFVSYKQVITSFLLSRESEKLTLRWLANPTVTEAS